MKRPNKQKCVDLIVKLISEGNTFSSSLERFRGNWSGFAESTFANYWNDAQKIHTAKRERIQKEIEEQTIQHELERNKCDLLTKDRALEILKQIAEREDTDKEGNAVNDSNRVRAIDQISKMEGWLSPTQNENINTNINQQPVIIQFEQPNEDE